MRHSSLHRGPSRGDNGEEKNILGQVSVFNGPTSSYYEDAYDSPRARVVFPRIQSQRNYVPSRPSTTSNNPSTNNNGNQPSYLRFTAPRTPRTPGGSKRNTVRKLPSQAPVVRAKTEALTHPSLMPSPLLSFWCNEWVLIKF